MHSSAWDSGSGQQHGGEEWSATWRGVVRGSGQQHGGEWSGGVVSNMKGVVSIMEGSGHCMSACMYSYVCRQETSTSSVNMQ